VIVHLVAEASDLWVCRFAAEGERGTWRVDLVTCPWCRAGRYRWTDSPVRFDVVAAARAGL
jgi:hypothetical protein